MSLTIIADKKHHIDLLCTTLGEISDNIRSYNSFSKTALEDPETLLIAVISDSNFQEAVSYTKEREMFAILETSQRIGDTEFEEIFIIPLRLGYLTQRIKHSLQKRKERKTMVPLSLGNLTLDPRVSRLYDKNNDQDIFLTEKEIAILLFLSHQKGKAVSKQELLNEIWNYADNVETHTLETHLYRLRQKLKIQLNVNNFLVTSENGYFLNF